MKNLYRSVFFPLVLFVTALSVALSVTLSVTCCSAFAGEKTVGIAVSKRIRPYVEVLDGIVKGLGQKSPTGVSLKPDVVFLPEAGSLEELKKRLAEEAYDVLVAVGPEAGELVWSMEGFGDLAASNHPPGFYPRKRIYSAVLNPEKMMVRAANNRGGALPNHETPQGCGISLKIPVASQVETIAETFPDLERIGILFDPRYNQLFFETAAASAARKQVKILPLAVDSKKEIPKVLDENWHKIDCVWLIPDPTVISEKIVQYVIKQALYNNLGVVGYNPFFTRSGAFFSFAFDYGKIGLQTAQQVISWLEKGVCASPPPLFQRQINTGMVKKLGIRPKGEERP
ncbi:MAG: ABC transporter substrate binding protein [Desulfobacteraceae bacterium]